MKKVLYHIAKYKRWYLVGCTGLILICFFLPWYYTLPSYLVSGFKVITSSKEEITGRYILTFSLTCLVLFSTLLILLLICLHKNNYFVFFNLSSIILSIHLFCSSATVLAPVYLIFFLSVLSIILQLCLSEKRTKEILAKAPMSNKQKIKELESRVRELEEKDREQK